MAEQLRCRNGAHTVATPRRAARLQVVLARTQQQQQQQRLAAQREPAAEREAAVPSSRVARRNVLGGLLAGGALATLLPGAALADGSEPSVINDPAALRAKLTALYGEWATGRTTAWLAGQPSGGGGLKWTSTYNGMPYKAKGPAAVAAYWDMLRADFDISSYKPLAIFIDNDGDEATVVVDVEGTARRTGEGFKTVFLHSYTIGPNFAVIKLKEQTDTALLGQLVPPPPAATAAAAASAAAETGTPVQPGPAAKQV